MFQRKKNVFLGFIGDRVGYNVLLIVNLILAGVSATCFDLTPRFKKHYKIPTLTVGYDSNTNTTLALEFLWPVENCTLNATVDDCKEAPILSQEGEIFWENPADFMNCDSSNKPDFNLTEEPYFPCKLPSSDFTTFYLIFCYRY